MADSSRIVVEPHSFPYFAAVFSWIGVGDAEPREAFVAEIFRIAAKTQGFLGAERARGAEPAAVFGITIFYWATRAALGSWQADVERHVRDSFRDGDQTGMYEDWILRVVEVQDALRMPTARQA
ncbi:MAG: hypothetical protein KDK53_07300 [Maritimibacter sp.]|nr:hypothetical protein [Maritimibacter sp.]